MNDQVKILEMVQSGTITPTEAAELLKALGAEEPNIEVKNEGANTNETNVSGNNGNYKYLKVKVITEKGDTKVNVNIPLKLVRAVGGLLKNVESFMPEEAKTEMHSKGINLSTLDITAIIDLLESGELENNTLVEVEANDENEGRTQVKVYVE